MFNSVLGYPVAQCHLFSPFFRMGFTLKSSNEKGGFFPLGGLSHVEFLLLSIQPGIVDGIFVG